MVSMMFRWVSHLHVSPPCRTSVFRQNGLRFYVESLSKKLQVQGSLLLEQLRWIMISSIPGVQMWMVGYLGCGFKYVLFSPRKLGKIPNLANIFHTGWFNHQPVMYTTIIFLEPLIYSPAVLIGGSERAFWRVGSAQK